MAPKSDAMAEIRAGFLAECEELLEALHEGLTAFLDGTSDAETLNVVFRAVHSIKGGAGAFGMDEVTAFTHVFESALDHFRENPDETIVPSTKTFIQAADVLQDLLESQSEEGSISDIQTGDIIEALRFLGNQTSQPEVPSPALFKPVPAPKSQPKSTQKISLNFEPSSELFTTGNEPLFLLATLADTATCKTECLQDRIPKFSDLDPETSYLRWAIEIDSDVSVADIREVFDFAEGLCKLEFSGILQEPSSVTVLQQQDPPSPPKSQQAPAKSTVRVDLERVDQLVNLVGELVINQSMLHQNVIESNAAANSPLMVGLEDFMQLTAEIQESVMMIRAQPVKSLFQRMGRVVREAASSTQKEVRFVTEGDSTEIDKTVLERLTEPLTHILRNSIDHGLEEPSIRKAQGKSEVGTITLSASHKSGRVIIEVSDDGAGLDFERILNKAIDQNIISPDADLSDTEKTNLLFQPGFSTAENISHLSGRGVGMDVVKTSIQNLGGRVQMTSTSGQGTTLTASLPLTLSVVDGMVIHVAGQTMVVPLGTVEETLMIDETALRYFKPSHPIIELQGKPTRLLDLGLALHLRPRLQDFSNKVALIFRNEQDEDVAIVVDDITDQRQVVIKGIKHSFGPLPGISAATILGNGEVALILDPFDLILTESCDPTPLSKAS